MTAENPVGTTEGLPQGRILDLLIEASNPNCTWMRRIKIQNILGHAIVDDSAREGISLVLDGLYVKTLKNRPVKLVELFPFFALVCGERDENSRVAKIDWNLEEEYRRK